MEGAAGEPGEREAGIALRWSRRRLLGSAAALLALGAAPTRGAAAMDELQFFRIGTAATTGTYFQIGAMLASAISKPPGSRECERGGSCGVTGLVAVAQATQGSIANVLAVGSGELESALAQSEIAYWGYTGTGTEPSRCRAPPKGAAARNGIAMLKSRGPIRNLRAIAGLYPESVHVVVRGDGTIGQLHDLKGKRIALGEAQSGTLAEARLVLAAAGLSECDLKPHYFSISEAVSALTRGEIDGLFMVAGAPVPAIMDAATAVPIRLLAVTDETARRLVGKFPFFHTDTIPAGSYPGVAADVPTVSTTALWIVAAEIPDNLVYAITQALWRDATRRLLESAQTEGKRIRLAAALDGVVIPVHPGAARFYQEAGMMVPEASR